MKRQLAMTAIASILALGVVSGPATADDSTGETATTTTSTPTDPADPGVDPNEPANVGPPSSYPELSVSNGGKLGLMPNGAQVAVAYSWEGIDYGVRDNSLDPGFHSESHGFRGEGGSISYYGDDDDFRVFDEAADGLRVGLEYKTDYARWGMCVSKEGNSLEGERKCYKDFAEGHSMMMRMLVCDGSVHTCGQPGSGGAGWLARTAWFDFST